MNLAIIDTGCANLASLKFALDRLGQKSIITHDLKELSQADKLLLPGVGTAAKAMENLQALNLENFLQTTTKPLLGICLGMQILGNFSQELEQETLKIIDFETIKFKQKADFTFPHMGWNQVSSTHELFKGLNGAYFYFVHSYHISLNAYTIAECEYSTKFSASVNRANFYGVQFHPERSGEAGKVLLKNFISM